MLDIVPDPRDGESLYSVLARMTRYLDAPEAGPLMEKLLGRRWAIASHDLPGNLATLVRELRAEARPAAIDRLIDGLTLLPFHTAFVPDDLRRSTRAAMSGDTTGIYTRLGLAAFKVRPVTRLRFCADCLDDMERERGDAWWRREHQLPGVMTCFLHGSVLRESLVDLAASSRHAFVAASRANCPGNAPPVLPSVGDAVLARLRDLTDAAVLTLRSPPAAMSHSQRADGYRARLGAAGLMRSRGRADLERLAAAFRGHWGGALDLVPGFDIGEDVEHTWLAAMVRTGRRAAHPMRHLLLQGFLDSLDVVEAVRPFGAGPWPCRNPVSGHHGEQVVVDLVIRRDRAMRYGDFGCACGYVYTRSLSQDGAIGDPRFRSFGPTLRPAVEAALLRGDGLRATARLVGLDPKTLMREVAMAGIAVPWSTKASGKVVTRGGKVSDGTSAARPTPAPARARRNWFAIDARLARSSAIVARDLRSASPPVRATFAAIERRIARRDWIVSRRAKLPNTVAAIDGLVEAVDDFRVRRMEWHVREAVRRADLRPCEVLRRAGLPTDWMGRVRDALHLAQLDVRWVA